MRKKVKLIILAFTAVLFTLFFFKELPKFFTVKAQSCVCNAWEYYSYTCTSGGYTGFCSYAWCTDWGNNCSSAQCGPGTYPCNRPGGCCPIGEVTPTDVPGGGPGCTTGGWVDDICYHPACSYGYRLQTRTVDPAGCAQDWRCNLDATCESLPPWCTIDVPPPDPIEIYPGETKDVIPAIVQNPGSSGAYVDYVSFDLTSATNFGVCDSSTAVPPGCTIGTASYTDSSSAFAARVTASNAVGSSASINVNGHMNSGNVCAPDSSTITIINNPAWCQAKEGDVVAVGNINCQIPTSCVSPGCNPSLVTYDTGDDPGVVVAGGTVSDGGGGTSVPPLSPNLTVQGDPYNGTPFDYAYFEKKAAGVTFSPTIGPSVNPGDLTSGSTYANYHWKRTAGPATITGSVNLGTENVVLFVNGNLTINGGIRVTPGQGFFMAVVNGDILVSPTVGGAADATPDLEGLYFADGAFTTGTNGPALDNQLHVRGSVAAQSFAMQRDLPNNSVTPAEFFEFGPDQVMQMPSFLSRKQVIWREVAP